VFYVHGAHIENPNVFALNGNGYSTPDGASLYRLLVRVFHSYLFSKKIKGI
jgi:hypothetical protein